MIAGLLRGVRVHLSALTNDDLAAIATWHGDDATLRLFDAIPAVPKSRAQLERWLTDAQAATDGFTFAVRLNGTGKLVGVLQVDGILWAHRVGWLSVLIGDLAERGKGYGSEALELALRFAFHELNLHRVALTVFAYNTRAITTYERLGFRQEGAHREFLERDGQRHDMLLFGLLRREWEEQRQEHARN
jgi:RimJ/RimL family protein N-acetyltransferase